MGVRVPPEAPINNNMIKIRYVDDLKCYLLGEADISLEALYPIIKAAYENVFDEVNDHTDLENDEYGPFIMFTTDFDGTYTDQVDAIDPDTQLIDRYSTYDKYGFLEISEYGTDATYEPVATSEQAKKLQRLIFLYVNKLHADDKLGELKGLTEL